MRNRFITSSGRTVRVTFQAEEHVHGRDALDMIFEVSSTGPPEPRIVRFHQPPMIRTELTNQTNLDFDSERQVLAVGAILNTIDGDESLRDADRPEVINIDADAVLAAVGMRPLDDRALRRYIARRAYDHYRGNTLNEPFSFDNVDSLITGAGDRDIRRNVEVLVEEKYLQFVALPATGGYTIRPTAQLIRSVERYGAAEEDVPSGEEYAAVFDAYPQLREYRAAVVLERSRFVVARSPSELMSVFRAIAPTVESVVKGLLHSHGSKTDHTSLGPMIADMQARGIGDSGVYQQLSHILKFGRDLALHGADMPESVLRIAIENAFELLPQLASLYLEGLPPTTNP
jgi:hypothetical protein